MNIFTGNGYKFQIDDEDLEKISKLHWVGIIRKHFGRKYAIYLSAKLNGRNVYLHRYLMNAPKGIQVDHINLDGLDNRKSNLRFCTNSQNHMNSAKQINNTSGYKGVRWHKISKKWISEIKVNGKTLYLGLFRDKEKAANAYDEAAIKYFGEFARTNGEAKS